MTFTSGPPSGEVLTRLELLEHAWDYGYDNRSNVVDVYVRSPSSRPRVAAPRPTCRRVESERSDLREKIDRPFGLDAIETVRGTGYRLRADGGG